MGRIAGSIRDAATGDKVQARAQVLDPTGLPTAPEGAIWKVGPGEPFFYSGGEFTVETTRGYYRVLVERGTEYRPWQTTVHVGKSENATVGHRPGTLVRSSRARLAPRQHPHPLRRKRDAARRAARLRLPHRGPAHDCGEHSEALGPGIRHEQVRARRDERIHRHPPLRTVRRGDAPQLQPVPRDRLRPRHAAQHPQRRGPAQQGDSLSIDSSRTIPR